MQYGDSISISNGKRAPALWRVTAKNKRVILKITNDKLWKMPCAFWKVLSNPLQKASKVHIHPFYNRKKRNCFRLHYRCFSSTDIVSGAYFCIVSSGTKIWWGCSLLDRFRSSHKLYPQRLLYFGFFIFFAADNICHDIWPMNSKTFFTT